MYFKNVQSKIKLSMWLNYIERKWHHVKNQIRNRGGTESIEYKSAADFLANQRLEVPDLEDYYKIVDVTLDGKPVELKDKTIIGLYKKFDNEDD